MFDRELGHMEQVEGEGGVESSSDFSGPTASFKSPPPPPHLDLAGMITSTGPGQTVLLSSYHSDHPIFSCWCKGGCLYWIPVFFGIGYIQERAYRSTALL
jgi:hypothetical protein